MRINYACSALNVIHKGVGLHGVLCTTCNYVYCCRYNRCSK